MPDRAGADVGFHAEQARDQLQASVAAPVLSRSDVGGERLGRMLVARLRFE